MGFAVLYPSYEPALYPRHCERSEAIHLFPRCTMDRFASLAMTGREHQPAASSSASALACAGGAGIGNFSYCFGKFTGR